MKKFLTSTRGRLTLVSVAVLAAALAVADSGLYASLAISQGRESDAALVSQSSTIASGLEDLDGQIRFGGGDIPGETQTGIAIAAAVVGPQGAMVQTPAQPLSSSTLAALAARATRAGGPIWADVTDTRHVSRRVYAERLPAGQGSPQVLIVSRSLHELQASLRRTGLFLAVFSLLMVLLGGLLAYWLAGRVLRPVRTIAGIARSLSERDLHRRVDVKVPEDELGELVDTFNGMLGRLEAGFDSLRRFTGDASHELRAPLTLMLTELDVGLTRARSKEEYERILRTIRTEVQYLARVTDQLLILARADAGVLTPQREPLDAADFVHETAARWSATARQRRVRLDVTTPDSGTVLADPALARRVMDNLIDNAIRCSPPGGSVSILAEHGDRRWLFEVADDGPGVPAQYRPHLFQRFSRADSARTREGGGAGLGLALGAAIAEAHGGDLRLVSRAGRGAVFQLRLPGGSAHP